MGTTGHQVPGPGKKVEPPKEEEPKVRNVIPIIFIPGIAGSNLKVRENMEEVVRKRMDRPKSEEVPHPWRPPDLNWKGVKRIWAWDKYGPRVRQALLNTETTAVDDDGFLALGMKGVLERSCTVKGRRFRGWNSVHHLSYLEYLNFLEMVFNPRFQQFESPSLSSKKVIINGYLKQMIEFKGDFKFRMDKNGLKNCSVDYAIVEKIQEHLMPVFAFGYNWLNSNQDAAENLYSVMGKIIKFYSEIKSNNKNLFRCKKIILVTHSMGGLVARAVQRYEANKGIGTANSLIMGIVQVVMPAIGTPSAYGRMVSGVEWEICPEDAVLAPRLRNAATILMGSDTERTTPVMAYSPGCLQLLPTADYPKGWLVIGFPRIGGRTDDIIKIPENDPYFEIYQNTKSWYRLVEQEYLDPGGLYINKYGGSWGRYCDCLSQAKNFHEELKRTIVGIGKEHIPTYVCYGNDNNHLTHSIVRWHVLNPDVPIHATKSKIQNAIFICSIPQTKGTVRSITFDAPSIRRKSTIIECRIQPKDSSGDGTVAWQSACAPEDYGLKGRVWALRGFDHQFSMKSEVVQMFTVWAICKIFENNL